MRLRVAFRHNNRVLGSAIAVAGLMGAGIPFVLGYLNPAALVGLVTLIPATLLFALVVRAGMARIRRLCSQLRWWHISWLLLLLSSFVFRVRTFESATDMPVDFWAVYRAGLVGVVAFVLLANEALKGVHWTPYLLRGLLGLIGAYTLVAIVSTTWSVYPSWTLYKSLEYFVDVGLLATIMASIRSTKEFKVLLDWTWLLLGVTLCTVWIGILIWPQAITTGTGTLGIQIQGVFPAISSNGVGELAALLAVVAFARVMHSAQGRQWYVVLLLLALVTLVLAQSRSPLTAFLVAVPLVLSAGRKIAGMAVVALLLLVILPLTSLPSLFWHYFLRNQSMDLFRSLSGRTEWWELALATFRTQPITGLGAYAGSQFGVMAAFTSDMSSVHSTWIELLVDTGVLGLVPIALAVLGAWMHALGALRHVSVGGLEHRLLVEVIGVLAVLSVRSVFTSVLIWHPSLQYLAAIAYIDFLRRQLRLNRKSRDPLLPQDGFAAKAYPKQGESM